MTFHNRADAFHAKPVETGAAPSYNEANETGRKGCKVKVQAVPNVQGGEKNDSVQALQNRRRQIDKQIAQVQKDQNIKKEVKNAQVQALRTEQKTIDQKMSKVSKKESARQEGTTGTVEKAVEFVKGAAVKGIYSLDQEKGGSLKLNFNKPTKSE